MDALHEPKGVSGRHVIFLLVYGSFSRGRKSLNEVREGEESPLTGIAFQKYQEPGLENLIDIKFIIQVLKSF